MSFKKVERQGHINFFSSPVYTHWCHTSDNVFITDIIIINVYVHCTQLYCHQYLVADADQTIVETQGQVLSIIGPAAAGDSTAGFVFGHRLLLWRP